MTGNTVRGFESLHLRHKHKGPPMRRSLVLMHEVSSDSNPRALGNLPGAGFNPRRPAPQGRSNPSISAMASEQATYRLLRLFTPAAKKSECAHSAAPPFKPATASLGCGFANQGTLAGAKSAMLRCLFMPMAKSHHPLRSLTPPFRRCNRILKCFFRQLE